MLGRSSKLYAGISGVTEMEFFFLKIFPGKKTGNKNAQDAIKTGVKKNFVRDASFN